MPQRQRVQCPHCESLLRDRKEASFSRAENIGLFVALLLAFSIPWREVRQVLFVAIMGLWLLLIVRRTKWSIPDESRYAKDDAP